MSKAWLAAVLFGGCIVPDARIGDSGSEAEDGGLADGGGGSDTTTEAFCADAPVLTWANFGHGFMLENCQGCHASTAPDRHDAPEGATFDTVDEVWELAGLILYYTTGDDPSMPPTGGVTEDDRLRLEYWLRCAEPGT